MAKRISTWRSSSEGRATSWYETVLRVFYFRQVAVRVRPLWRKEIQEGHHDIVRVMSDKVVILMDPLEMSPDNDRNVLNNRVREKQYAFDYAFHNKIEQVVHL